MSAVDIPEHIRSTRPNEKYHTLWVLNLIDEFWFGGTDYDPNPAAEDFLQRGAQLERSPGSGLCLRGSFANQPLQQQLLPKWDIRVVCIIYGMFFENKTFFMLRFHTVGTETVGRGHYFISCEILPDFRIFNDKWKQSPVLSYFFFIIMCKYTVYVGGIEFFFILLINLESNPKVNTSWPCPPGKLITSRQTSSFLLYETDGALFTLRRFITRTANHENDAGSGSRLTHFRREIIIKTADV